MKDVRASRTCLAIRANERAKTKGKREIERGRERVCEVERKL